jgi:hypothetical protein
MYVVGTSWTVRGSHPGRCKRFILQNVQTRLRWEDNINMDLQEVGCGVWTGSRWLSVGTFDWHL